MVHGVQGFFAERARSAQRVSVLAAGVAFVLLGALLALVLPTLRRPVREMVRQTTRFGYEGTDQFVRRITLQQFQGSATVLRDLGSIDMKRERGGGTPRARRAEHPNAQPRVRANVAGPGQADRDMMAHAVSRLANVPVVQSEDLVIEHASLPIYPENESARGVEGKVMVQALVDTTGRVVDVQLLASSGVGAFERSASEAVWQYRFRPYRLSGTPSEVYAIFRFSFRVY